MPKLEIYYHNIGGLGTKIGDLALKFASMPYDVVILIETWLNDNIYI